MSRAQPLPGGPLSHNTCLLIWVLCHYASPRCRYSFFLCRYFSSFFFYPLDLARVLAPPHTRPLLSLVLSFWTDSLCLSLTRDGGHIFLDSSAFVARMRKGTVCWSLFLFEIPRFALGIGFKFNFVFVVILVSFSSLTDYYWHHLKGYFVLNCKFVSFLVCVMLGSTLVQYS